MPTHSNVLKDLNDSYFIARRSIRLSKKIEGLTKSCITRCRWLLRNEGVSHPYYSVRASLEVNSPNSLACSKSEWRSSMQDIPCDPPTFPAHKP